MSSLAVFHCVLAAQVLTLWRGGIGPQESDQAPRSAAPVTLARPAAAAPEPAPVFASAAESAAMSQRAFLMQVRREAFKAD
jgi:hypothetical protein